MQILHALVMVPLSTLQSRNVNILLPPLAQLQQLLVCATL
jgi:hypothetical protein